MKRFLSFVKKEFYHILRDKRTMFILFGLPVAELLLFGYVITNEIKDAKIAIVDHSKDNVTKEITNKILSSGFFILDENISQSDNLEEILQKGNVKEIIVFENDFAKNLERENIANIQIIADATDANTAQLLVGYTAGIISDYASQLKQDFDLPMQIKTETRMLYNESLRGVYMFVPGIMALILMLVCTLMTSVSITREKEYGTMEVLLVSPIRPIQIILGKVTPYLLLSFINMVTILFLSFAVFDVPVQGSLVLLVFVSTIYILLALSLGILISTFTDSQQVAMFISGFALMLPTMLLSGFIFPIENMPKILQWICYVMPPKYFIIIVKNIMLKGTGIFFIWKEILVLLGMTSFFILLSSLKFKIRLD